MKSICYLLICLIELPFDLKVQSTRLTSSAEANFSLGLKLFELGHAEDALPYFQTAVNIKGESYPFRFYTARVAHFFGKYEPWVENFNHALRLIPIQIFCRRDRQINSLGHVARRRHEIYGKPLEERMLYNPKLDKDYEFITFWNIAFGFSENRLVYIANDKIWGKKIKNVNQE